jgi:hypothetical protein
MIPNLNLQEIHDTIPGMRPAMADADLIKTMALHIDLVEAQRGMLARRCADQARRIGVLMCQENRRLTVSAEEVIKALRERADEDGALHFDAIREVLIKLGARP